MPRLAAILPVLSAGLAVLGCGGGGDSRPPDGGRDASGTLVDAMPMGCIDIPPMPAAAPVPSLAVKPRVLLARSPLDVSTGRARGPVLAFDRMIVAAGPWVARYHLSGELEYSVSVGGGPHTVLGRPTVTDNGFVWAAADVGLFGLVGVKDTTPAGFRPYDNLEQSTRPSPDALNDGTNVYVSSADGTLIGGAHRADPLWRRRIGTPQRGPRFLGPGAGRVLAAMADVEIGSWLWDADTGEPLGVPRSGLGGWVYPQAFAASIGLIGHEYRSGSRLTGTVVALDRCGTELWRHDTGILFPVVQIIGFDDQVFVWHKNDDGRSIDLFERLSSTGMLETPTPLPGRPMVLGADGLLYVADCVTPPERSDGALVAYDRELAELWRFPLGFCPSTNPVLLDDGRLFLTGSNFDGGWGLTIVQTTSPGLAPTAWPAPFHDNSSSSWLRSPVP